MDAVVAVQLLGGAARWQELIAHGVERAGIDAACRGQVLVRCGRGVVCLPGAQDAPQTVAVRFGAVLSCGAAADHHGLELFGPHRLHLTRSSPLPTRHPTRVALHIRRTVQTDSRATNLRQTLLDCARCLPLEQAVSVLDSALRQGRVEPEELVALVPRSGPYVAKVAEVVGLTDPLAQSVLESGARVLLVTADLGPVTSQVQFERVGWVDLVVCGWLVIEVDGFAVHRERFNEDRRRDAELSRLGYVVLRFTYEDVLRRPGWVLEVVRDTLRAGRPPCADQRQARER